MKCDECKQLALNIDATSLIHLRVTAPHSPSTGQQSSPPPLGLSVFRTASDFLQDVKDSDTKENDLIVPNRPFDYFDLAPQNKPQLGDLIEIDRTLYSHWAVYVGGGRVVHVVGEENQDLPDTEHAVVREHFLIDIAVSSFVRVNNKEVPAKERGMASFDSDTVVANAKSMVGSRVVYNMLTKNCEHYLTEWKYGKAWSDQASVALTAIKALKRDSSSAGHTYLVNTLNTVLNSPGAGSPSSPVFPRSAASSISSSDSTASHTVSQSPA